MSAANSLPWNDQGIRFTVDIKTISENNAQRLACTARCAVATSQGKARTRGSEVGLQVGGYGVEILVRSKSTSGIENLTFT